MTFSELYEKAVAAQAHGEYLHLECDQDRVAIQPLEGGEVRIINLAQPEQGTVLDRASYDLTQYKSWTIAHNQKDFFNRLGARYGT